MSKYNYVPIKGWVKNPPLQVGKTSTFKLFAFEKTEISPHDTVLHGLGYAIAAPEGKMILIFPEPDTGFKGLTVAPTLVTLHTCKEVNVNITSIWNTGATIYPGECIARMVFIDSEPISITPLSRKRVQEQPGKSSEYMQGVAVPEGEELVGDLCGWGTPKVAKESPITSDI